MPIQFYSNLSSKSGQGSVTTSGTGTPYVALASQLCNSVTIINATGQSLDVTKDGGTTKVVLPTGASFNFENIANANVVSVRRTDQSATAVTAYYNWCN
jgi:hypothetical protein